MTTINEAKTLSLLDGTTFEGRPLKISLLRKFMTNFEKLQDVAEDNGKSMDVLIKCVQIALEQYLPEFAGRKDLEDLLDLPTVYAVVEVASGIKLGENAGSII